MQNYDEIIPNIYVGNRHSLDHSHNFSLIVNCTTTVPFQSSMSEMVRISVDDDPSNSSEMFNILHNENILQKIYNHERLGQKVLINCSQGIQRSCAVCACLLVTYKNYTPMKAVNFIKEKRPLAFNGSINFISVIKKFNTKKYKALLNNHVESHINLP